MTVVNQAHGQLVEGAAAQTCTQHEAQLPRRPSEAS
jgi:hypothetical protein